MNISLFCPLGGFLSAGITVDKYGVIFFVDGTMIRRIDQNGIISTVLGFNDLTSARPLSCDAVMDISQVRPLWPGQQNVFSPVSQHTPISLNNPGQAADIPIWA